MGNSSSTDGPWAPKPAERTASELPTIAVLGGTGRMGVHLSAAWANAGYDVTMCSRKKEKASRRHDHFLSVFLRKLFKGQ